MTSSTKKYYPFLDGFRAIAVAWIGLHHIYFFFNIHAVFIQIHALIYKFFRFDSSIILQIIESLLSKIALVGNLGVDMFFVISGFLITGVLISCLEGDLNIKRFYLRRSFKIIPQYVLALFGGFLVAYFFQNIKIISGIVPISVTESAARPLSYFLFLQNYFPDVAPLAHTWAIVIEEHFYLFYPLILYFLCKKPQSPEKRRKIFIRVCLLFILLGNVIRMYYYHYGHGLLANIHEAPTVIQTTLFRADALAFGCLLRFLEPYYAGKNSIFFKSLGFISLIIGIFIYGIFLCGYLTVGGFGNDTWYAYTLAYIAPGCILLAAHLGFPLFAEMRILRFIGRYSYGIYLWHYILLFPFPILFNRLDPITSVLCYLLVTLLAGIITTASIEKYFLNVRAKVAP